MTRKNRNDQKGMGEKLTWLYGAAAACLLPACYLLMLLPNKKEKKQLKGFQNRCYAHRGVFRNGGEAPENSMNAFERAVRLQYGIELDVQLSRDKKMVVFHDSDLKRAAGVDKKVSELTYEELKSYPLFGSQERIPLFEEVLAMVDGRVPLIVEIKTRWDYREICPRVSELLSAYHGPYCIESFQPFALHWFRKHNPAVIRGQLSENFFRDRVKDNAFIRFLLGNLLLNFLAKPDFIAYNCRDKHNFSFHLCRRFFGVATAAWTVRSEQQLRDNRKDFDMIIFDGFLPGRMEG